MEEKRFDSAESFLDFAKKNHVSMDYFYVGYIDAMEKYLVNNCGQFIYGAPPEDFFIQGLIAITADPDAFKSTLDKYLKKRGFIV